MEMYEIIKGECVVKEKERRLRWSFGDFNIRSLWINVIFI